VTAGEAWTREVLGELRASRYRASAWGRFFASSFARSRLTRQERRREHRRTLQLGAAGFAAWAALAAVRPWLALAGSLWWLLVIAMLDWHLGMLEDERGQPLRRLGIANLLSLARAAVIPVLLDAPPGLLAVILIAAGVSDAIDGPLARRRGEETRLGRWLDGGVDSLLLSAAALDGARHGLLPWWVAALVLVRYGLPWLVVSLAYFVRAAPPSRAGLVSGRTPGLILFAGLALAALRLPGAAPLVAAGAAGGIATLSITLARAHRLQPAT
jgi:phosphatidylglycerophosphate synthase